MHAALILSREAGGAYFLPSLLIWQAVLLSIDTDNFCVGLRLEGGAREGRTLERVEYEDVCKLAS